MRGGGGGRQAEKVKATNKVNEKKKEETRLFIGISRRCPRGGHQRTRAEKRAVPELGIS